MRKRRRIVNLYNDAKTSTIKHVISISSHNDLNQFWKFVNSTNNPQYKLINQFSTQLYNFSLTYISNEKTIFFEIIVEESDENFYFTIWNQNAAIEFEKYIEKTSTEFIHQLNRITIKINKS